MLNSFKKRIISSEPFLRLRERVSEFPTGTRVTIRGLSGSLLSIALEMIYESSGNQVLVILPDRDSAERTVDDCSSIIGPSQVFVYLHTSHHSATLLDMSAPVGQVETLKALTERRKGIIIASAEAIASLLPSPVSFAERAFILESGNEYPFEPLLARLSELGFERKDFVEEYGDVAVRGGILDIFPFIGEHPIRVEFWGDTIESIREFDVLSQRSIRELQSANIIANLLDGETAHKRDSSLFDYLSSEAIVFVDEPSFIQNELKELEREGVEDLLPWESIEKTINRFPTVFHRRITTLLDRIDVDFQSTSQPGFQGAIKLLLAQMRKYLADGNEVHITCDTEEEAERIEELIEEELTDPGSSSLPPTTFQEYDDSIGVSSLNGWNIMTGALHSGFAFPPAGIVLLTEHEIFGRLKRRGKGSKSRLRGFTHKEAQQLRRGDFVVHTDYGIGRFDGLQTIKVRGVDQEVMRINYEENDTLYVNLNYINRVQKYSSREGHTPKITKLGTPQWDRLKAKARKRIKDIARELIALYARRKLDPGFAFAPDSHWQKELEASFMYEDTPDQAKATFEVKEDMHNGAPMDRLICGDVGFGKTEVAVRAAFKAVLDGKQVCLLVPTTILAQQHLNTFRDRLNRYTVRVDALSRFRSKKEQSQILENLVGGKTDIVIGTHRLLSKDVKFKDLGLLIVDEEHRFGVSAKEKIRQMRANVDTLTLTATPIPRTLQFSLLGARDLSIINTPPRNRLPIHTEIAQFDLKLIREVVLKELHRRGQVYFIHDRVHDIEDVLIMLERHIPEARFHIAHGQMKGHELEKTMLAFLEKKYDVLLCTKIIESGIDIPSVNTIIINRADRFGMAELYQLRGRVGRSNIQAYAYLLTPPLPTLPRTTLQRLQTIQEFTELGSGFNLAMRDLEIRGAGNLLGAEQSGFILEMGFETYQKILEEAVSELKQEEFGEIFTDTIGGGRKRQETIIETDIEALIPAIYIEIDAERLDIYRRLYNAETIEAVQSLRSELKDRFGEFPEEVGCLFDTVELKVLAADLEFEKVELSGSTLTLSFPPPDNKKFYEGEESGDSPFQLMMSRISTLQEYKPRLKQKGDVLTMQVQVDGTANPTERIVEARSFLERLRRDLVGQS